MANDAVFIPSNRQKVRAPKQHSFWCWHCDRAWIHEGAKCPVCHKRDHTKRLKWEPVANG